jgi:hypothetical protein
MDEFVTLQQGAPTVVLIDGEKPQIVTSVEVEEVILQRNGAVFENHILNAPVTYVTEVTEVIEPEDPGDLTLLFDNKLI